MAKTPSVESLEKPEKFKDVLAKDKADDCTTCRLIGSGTLIGMAAYSFWEGRRQLEEQREAILKGNSRINFRTRQMGLAGISLGLLWMGVWRFLG